MTKTDKQKHTLQQLRSILIYKGVRDKPFTRYLLEMAEAFANDFYPKIVENSLKMSTSSSTSNDNLNVIINVRSLVKQSYDILST